MPYKTYNYKGVHGLEKRFFHVLAAILLWYWQPFWIFKSNVVLKMYDFCPLIVLKVLITLYYILNIQTILCNSNCRRKRSQIGLLVAIINAIFTIIFNGYHGYEHRVCYKDS